jgi:sporulation protein YlmC with PRC-barrel domain
MEGNIYNPQRNKHYMKAKEFIGKKVYDKNAIDIGKVTDLEMNKSSYIIEKIYIKSGMIKQCYVTPEDIDRIGDTVILTIAKEELKT